MGLKIYGIGAAESVDKFGEIVKIDGLDTSVLRGVRDEHVKDDFFHKVGAITFHKKIMSEKDCENAKQKRCWDETKVPFLYAEAELADEFEHPNAQASAAMIKFTQRPDISEIMQIGFSVHGGIYKKTNEDGTIDNKQGKIIAGAIATDLSLTAGPANPMCKLFLENDLTKSDLREAPPPRYFELLKQKQAASSFIESLEGKLVAQHIKLIKLQKSLDDFHHGMSSIQCHGCGSTVRFFKAGSVPSICNKCNTTYSLQNLWKALNK